MNYQVKKEYLGKVKLEDGTGVLVLDETTPQDVLAKVYDTVLGKGFIEPVAELPAAKQKADDNKAGQ
jgi:hypothetical protein